MLKPVSVACFTCVVDLKKKEKGVILELAVLRVSLKKAGDST